MRPVSVPAGKYHSNTGKPSQPRPIILSDSFNVKKISQNPAPNPLNLPVHSPNPLRYQSPAQKTEITQTRLKFPKKTRISCSAPLEPPYISY